MTYKEFVNKWMDTDRTYLTLEDEEEFVEDAFNMYEESGFIDKFKSPYLEGMPDNGKTFKVIRRVSVDDGVDIENLPMWIVEFEDGTQDYCYPEEICKIEHED